MLRTLAAARQRSFGAGCAAHTPTPARATPPTGPRLPPPSKWLRYTHRSHQLRTETHLEIKTRGFPSSPTKRGPLRSRLPARRHREPELQAPPASDWNALRRRAARAAGCLTTQCGSRTAGFERQPPPERPPVPTFAPRPPRRVPGRQSLPPRETSGPKLPPAPTGHPGHPRS